MKNEENKKPYKKIKKKTNKLQIKRKNFKARTTCFKCSSEKPYQLSRSLLEEGSTSLSNTRSKDFISLSPPKEKSVRAAVTSNIATASGPSIDVGSTTITTNALINMTGNKITNVGTPVNTTDAVNLKYIQDNYVSLGDPLGTSGYLKLTGGTMKGSLNMGGNNITNLPTATDADTDYAANVSFVLGKKALLDAAYLPLQTDLNTLQNTAADINAFLSVDDPSLSVYLWKKGGVMTGNIDMSSHSITGLPAVPTDPREAVSLTYLNTNYLALSGGTMTGNLNMGGHAITGVSTPLPTSPTSAANVDFVFQRLLFKTLSGRGNTTNPGLGQTMTAGSKFNWSWGNTSYLQTPNQTAFFNTASGNLSLQLLQRALYIFSWTVTFNSSTSSNFTLSYTNPGISITNQTIGYYSLVNGQTAQIFCQIPVENTPVTGSLPLIEITTSQAVSLNSVTWQICAVNIS